MREIVLAVIKTGGGSFLTLLFGMIATKVFAINLGPEGIGLFSLLRQTRDSFRTFATFNSNTALVQGIASRQGEERRKYVSVTSAIMLLGTGLTALALISFAPQIARVVLHQEDSTSISLIRWLSIPVALSIGVFYLSGMLNGYRAIGRLALVQVISAAATLLLAYPTALLVKQGHSLAFIGMMVISSAFGLGLAFLFLQRSGWMPSFHGIGPKDIDTGESARSYFSFALTTLIAGLASTWSNLAIRSMVVAQGGIVEAGIFDVAWTLSMMYIMLVLSSFGTYYLPTLSQTREMYARHDLIRRVFRLTLLIAIPIIMSIIVLKPLVIRILYSEEFLASTKIIRWMLIGDYFKSTSWVFSITITAFADKKTFLMSELLWNLGFLSLSAISLFLFRSLEGVGLSFALMYIAYLFFAFFYVWGHHNFIPERKLVLRWLIGLLLIAGASFCTWLDTYIKWSLVLFWLGLALAYSWFSLKSMERTQFFHLLSSNLRRITKAVANAN
jgi:O-antigen/teichoic acid export membrane protein